MADPLDVFRQRERPGYFVQPSTPPRDITALSGAELDSYLRGFSSPPIGNEPTVSPYSAQDLRLELARRGPTTRRMDEGFEDARISNPPPAPRRAAAAAPNQSTTARPSNTAATPAASTERLRQAVTPPSQPATQPAPPTPPSAPVSQQPSVLDMLRQRMAREMEGEDLRRVAEFGRGMLAASSPNFFTMLAGGARAQAEGDTSRMERLRQLAETERQQRALEGQEAGRVADEQYRQESLRLRREEAARAGRPQFQVVGVDRETGYAVVTDPRDPTQTPRILQGITPLQVAAQSIRSDAATLNRATTAGNQAVTAERERRRGLGLPAPTPQEEDAIFQPAFERARRAVTTAPSSENTTVAPPAPSQVLQYGGPRINPQRQ